ncbi:efflux RND transporter periplasmic adaptor subunit [Paenibacillus sp. WLX1005]|uniref:efflux RND transporter periplasmic adaptor subunit n=1 Tax=Paenibacillus sp. WLX1005 TaxID=3243766 RepID=UPI0039841953
MKKSWPTAFSALLLAVSLTACSTANNAAVEPTTTTVEVSTIKKQPLDAVYDLSGTLAAYDETPVSFRINGTVSSVGVDVGDRVNKGSVLARLDTADLQLEVENASQSVAAAQASLASSKASLTNAKAGQQAAAAGIASAQAQVESAQASQQGVLDGARPQEKAQAQNAVNKAQIAYDQAKTAATRAQTLFDNGLLTQQENEQAQTALDNADSGLKDAQEQLSLTLAGAKDSDRASAAAAVKQAQVGIENAQASVAQANAAVEQAQAGVEQAQASYDQAVISRDTAQLNLTRGNLQSPASGTILTKTLSAGQTVSAGTEVFTIGEINRLKVLLPVPDSEISQWKVGQQVSISLYDDVRTGKVSKLYPQTNENTGSISVEVAISNSNQDWKPGQVVSASRQASSQSGILVPVEAVVSSGSEPYVFKAVNGKAVQTTVKLGNLYNNSYEVTSGLKVGDKVVTRGADRLFNGDELKVSDAATNNAQGNSSAGQSNAASTGTNGEATAND